VVDVLEILPKVIEAGDIGVPARVLGDVEAAAELRAVRLEQCAGEGALKAGMADGFADGLVYAGGRGGVGEEGGGGGVRVG
jgi:hypothetical protein